MNHVAQCETRFHVPLEIVTDLSSALAPPYRGTPKISRKADWQRESAGEGNLILGVVVSISTGSAKSNREIDMRVYHGTTKRRAARIRMTGFIPRRGRIWFTTSLNYAKHRARTQARRTADQAEVLTCDLNPGSFKPNRFIHQSHVIVIRGRVPSSMLIDQRGMVVLPSHLTAEGLARWVNRLLGVKPHKGVGKRHTGIRRLESWLLEQLKKDPDRKFRDSELLGLMQEWIPDVMGSFRFDPQTHKAYRIPDAGEPADPEWWETVASSDEEVEERILDALMSKRADRRAKGLRMLAETEEPDLFEWCTMFMEDASIEVRVAAADVARQCEDAETDVIETWTEDVDKRVRAAAIGFMTKHGEDREDWFRAGLTDPETHVRVETAKHVGDLDPAVNKALFELALYDPNPKVAEVAKKMTTGKGYTTEVW